MKLVIISDAQRGLKQPIQEVFVGANWQRCPVHPMRNLLSHVPEGALPMVAASVRTIFELADRSAATKHLRQVIATLRERFPQVVALLEEAEEDMLPLYAFPLAHQRQIASTNPLKRLHKELDGRSGVVGISPNRAAVLQLLGGVLIEQADEWPVGRKYFSELWLRQLLNLPADKLTPPRLEAAA